MFKPLFINRYYQSEQSPVGECLRSFIGAMSPEVWDPVIYVSDRPPLLKDARWFVRFVHEQRWVQYYAAAVRRVLIPDLTWLPGYEWTAWGKRVAKMVINDIKNGSVKPDYIHSICFPVASHWAALKIKEETGLPWVMQFYDPWADNPYRPFKTKWFKDKDWAMERLAAEKADLIIHDNEVIADLWRERYGEEIGKKIVVLPLTVPLPTTKQNSPNLDNKNPLVISHIGNFMLNRRAEPFIKAVAELFKNHPEVRDRLKVNFIGMVTAEDKDLIHQKALDDVFVLHGMLKPVECEEFYQKTDIFLAVDGVNPDNVFFPSKILKYFYYQRPILGITPHGSVLDYELRTSKHAVFANVEITAIADYLYEAVTDYPALQDFDASYWQRFKPSSVVEQYKNFIEEKIVKV